MSDPITPPPAYTPAPAPVGVKTNTLSIVALILSIVGVSLGGVIVGHISLGQIKRTGEAGHGLALAGTIVGYVGCAGWIIFWIGLIVTSLLFASTPNYY